MQIIDDFLPADIYARVRAMLAAAPYCYGAKSNSRTDPHGHWSWKPLHDNRHNLADLTPQAHRIGLADVWREVCIRTNMSQKGCSQPSSCNQPCLIRCYVNGYTYGTDGYFHTDSGRHDEITAILYVCDRWEPDWAGETVVLSPSRSDIAGACLPRPNRLLVIPSDQLHAARAVSRKCPELRTVLVFKLRPRRSEEFEQLSTWLVQHGALQIDHQHGSLHDHLVRVYQLLEDRGLAVHCCRAGGLHSLYGTNAFKRQLLSASPHGRAEVAGAFGQPAENLSYMFSILNRPQTLDNTAAQFPFVGAANVGGTNLELRYNQSLHCDADTVRDLCLIECANLQDQNSLGKWRHLERLWQSLAPKSSAQMTTASTPGGKDAPPESERLHKIIDKHSLLSFTQMRPQKE